MEKLNPKAVWIFFFRFLGIGLFLTLTLGWSVITITDIVEFAFSWWMIILLAVIWLCGSYMWAKLSYDNYKFEIGEEVFKKENTRETPEDPIRKQRLGVPRRREQDRKAMAEANEEEVHQRLIQQRNTGSEQEEPRGDDGRQPKDFV